MKRVIFSKYSNERSAAFQIRTDILKDDQGKLSVTKSAMTEKAKAHIAHNELCAKQLADSFAGTCFVVCPCERINEETLEFSFLTGMQLDEMLDEALERQDEDAFFALLTVYKKEMQKLATASSEKTSEMTVQVANVDQIFQNIKVQDDKWYVYDYEWTFERPVPLGFIFYRAALFYSQFERRSYLERKGIDLFDFFGIDEAQKDRYREMEEQLQHYILGEYTRLWELYEIIHPENYDTIELVNEEKKRRHIGQVTVRKTYADRPATEEKVEAFVKTDDNGECVRILNVPVSSDIETLNMTLGNSTGMVHFISIDLWDKDNRVLLNNKPFLCNGTLSGEDYYEFSDDLPNLYFNELPDAAILHIEYQIGFGKDDLLGMTGKRLRDTEDRMQRRIRELEQELQKTKELNGILEADYNTVVQSAAWKSTKPIRKLADIMKGKSK